MNDILLKDIIGWIIGLVAVVGLPLGYWYKRGRHLKALYRVKAKKSSRLCPKEVLEIRAQKNHGFHKYFFPRCEVDNIQKRLADGKNVLVIGYPLAGKSRAVLQALRTMRKRRSVTIPRLIDIDAADFRVPISFHRIRKPILLLDDLNKFIGTRNFISHLQQFINKGYLIVATCRAETELAQAKVALEQHCSSLFLDPIEIGKISREDARTIALKTGEKPPEGFDGNIGSIFIDLLAMRLRFQNDLDDNGRAVMRSIKRLFMAGVYAEQELFSIERIKAVCASDLEQLDLNKNKWYSVWDSLESNGFLRRRKENAKVEEVYLEQVVECDFSLLANFRAMMVVFRDDPEALFRTGARTGAVLYSEEIKADHLNIMHFAIEAYEAALESLNINDNAARFANTQHNLGNAYWRLAEISNKAENCRKAIAAFTQALKVYTLSRFPVDWALTLSSLGNAYQRLGEEECKVENCQKAIVACSEALKVNTLKDLPVEYAWTQNNLGNAYLCLGSAKDKADNCRKAIEAYTEALKVRTMERSPTHYAMTQNNLGNAYCKLGEVEDKAANCREAIAAFSEALKVYTVKHHRIHYAHTHNNLGAAYWSLSKVENKAQNCRLACECYEIALAVYKEYNMPMQVKMVEHNLMVLLRKQMIEE